MMTYSFTLLGKITPYVRMTRRGQWVNPAALAYKASQSAIAWQLKRRMIEEGWAMLPGKTPLQVSILIEMPRRIHCQDTDNQVKALLDAAQGVVFPNDMWIDSIRAERRQGAEHRAVLEIGHLA